GDLSLWLETVGGDVTQATAQVELDDLQLAEAAETVSTFDRLAVTAEWAQSADGWSLSLSDLQLMRNGVRWPEIVNVGMSVTMSSGEPQALELDANFLRLEDLSPLISALPVEQITDVWQSLLPEGDVENLSLSLARGPEGLAYDVTAMFDGVGMAARGGRPGVRGVSGTLRADTGSGRLALATTDAQFEWPEMFREPIAIGELTGVMIWREGRNGIRLVSDNLTFNNADARTRSNLELIVPSDGGAPRLDLQSRVFGFDTTRTPSYLPVGVLPAPVVGWLDRAIIQGRVPEAEVAFFGPIDAFPFDNGEGQLRARFSVEDGVLAYVDDWPVAKAIEGEVEFLNAGFTAQGTGMIMNEDFARMTGGVADMRDAVLTVSGDVTASLGEFLDYLRAVPVTARRLGPDLSRLQSNSGSGVVTLDLNLPLKDIGAYALDAELAMNAGELEIQGFDLSANDIQGRLRLSDNVVTGEGIRAMLFGSPVIARVAAADEPGYRARLEVSGSVEAEALQQNFDLPFGSLFSGETAWEGHLLLPSNALDDDPTFEREPLRVAVASDLTGAGLGFPAPLEKPAAASMPLELAFTVLPTNRLDVEGHLGMSRRFALSFWSTDSGLQFRRGSVRFDGAYPLLPPDDGLDIEGNVRQLQLDGWLALLRGQDLLNRDEPILSRLDLDVTNMTALGQRLGATTFAVRQGRDEWLIELDSDRVAGHIAVPFELRGRPQIVADMQRLHLTFTDEPPARQIDPRDLPGLLVNSSDFAVGQRNFGRFSANVQSDPLGLRLVSYESVGDSFAVEGSGSWLAGPEGSTTRFALSLLSTDVGATLDDLGLQPIVEADELQVTASVNWPGGPSGRWQQGISGDLSLHIEQGSMINLEPGAGRMWGLLSFSALPRRLALDFRDVFNRGLVFDEVAGDFVLVDGNAYTDNLLLTGPVADIGVVGRTGLRNEDYQQQAVVTAEPGKVLPTMGFLAGPGVGAALLLFTQIFKEPLKGIGRASYCVTGSWDEPVVERLTPQQLQAGYLCADLPPSAATAADF
ncbi:MAG: TIGR02099 family protein, partial [Gammaproteobacteria bacterium]|nr:TIGR02099 family protein [Gammaproteobacteria bacterium]